MCQLFGVSANKPITLSMSMEEWVLRGEGNPHGFGFASWMKNEPTIEKVPDSLFRNRSEVLQKMVKRRGDTFLCHVRYATTGSKTESNTHPFKAKFEDGRDLVFAHNGCVNAVKNWTLNSYIPAGQTDSEHSFLWMLEQLRGVAPEMFARELKKQADQVQALGKFNFLMSDGQTTYAYADTSLHYLERKHFEPTQCIRLKDADLEFRLGDQKDPAEIATLIATEPLSDESGWTKLRAKSLAVVQDGEVRALIT